MPNFRIPGEEQLPGPANMGPANVGMQAPDFSAIERGTQALAGGFGNLAGSAGAIGDVLKKRQNVADFAKAEAMWTKGVLNLERGYSTSTKFDGMSERAERDSLKLKEEAAALIQDEDAKADWLNQAELKRLSLVNAASLRSEKLRQENERVEFGNALATSAEIIADPTIDEDTRNIARKQLLGTLDMGLETGLLLPAERVKFEREHLDVAEQNLAIGRAQLGILSDAQSVRDALAIPIGGGLQSSVLGATRLAQGGKTIAITPEQARAVAPLLGDTALPQDNKLAAAYLEDPEVNARYASAVMEQLTNRFGGDVGAAVIAAAPNGSLELAEKWVKSGHDDAVLPENVRNYYNKVMGGVTSGPSGRRIPVVGGAGVDLAKLDVGVLERFENVQTAIGLPLPVIGSDPAGSGIKVNIKKLKPEERIAVIQTASAMGFTGIGVDGDTLVLNNDGERAIVGKPPAWAKNVLEGHAAGTLDAPAPIARAVAPEYAALTFDQRLKLDAQAKAALDSHAVDLKAGLAISVENAPVAIAQMGQYTGTMPVVEDFVEAYGAAEGIERWKAFDAAVDTAEATFGMRTMPADEIADLVESATPRQGGDMAAVEQKRFETLHAAAAATLEARKKDPAGYVIEVFPGVAKAWEAVSDNPTDSNALAAAYTATATAQQSLGIDLELMPKAQADAIAAAFNNVDMPEDQRIKALTDTLFATKDETHQAALFEQLVKSGLPRTVAGALGALERNDQGASVRLFRAALLDPDKMPGQPKETDKDIALRMQEKLFDEGQIGNVLYGITAGRAENYQRFIDDGTLLTNAVKMRLVDGSAQNLDQAIDLAAKDLYGDVRVHTGKPFGGGAGAMIVLPADENPEPLRLGFNALLGQVGDALMANLTPAISGAPTSTSEAAIAVAARDNRIAEILEEGYFAPSGPDTYVFVDPATGQAIASPTGGELEFDRDQVIEAGAVAREASRANINERLGNMYGSNANLTDPKAAMERTGSIYGSNFGKPATRDPFK